METLVVETKALHGIKPVPQCNHVGSTAEYRGESIVILYTTCALITMHRHQNINKEAFTRAWLYVTIIDINTIILQYYSGYVGVGLGGITHGN